MAAPTLHGTPQVGSGTGTGQNTLTLTVSAGDLVIITDSNSTDAGTIAVSVGSGASLIDGEPTSLTLGSGGNSQVRVFQSGANNSIIHFWTLKVKDAGTVTLTPNWAQTQNGRLAAEVWTSPSGYHWPDARADRVISSTYNGTATSPNGGAWSSTPPTDVPTGIVVASYAAGAGMYLAVDDNGDGASYWGDPTGPGGGSIWRGYQSGTHYNCCFGEGFYDSGGITWGSYCGFATGLTGNKVCMAVIIKTEVDEPPTNYGHGFGDTLSDAIANPRKTFAGIGAKADTLTDALGYARKFAPRVAIPPHRTGALFSTEGNNQTLTGYTLDTINEGDLFVVSVIHASSTAPNINIMASGCQYEDLHLDLSTSYPSAAIYHFQWSCIIRNVTPGVTINATISGITNPNHKASVLMSAGDGYWGDSSRRVYHTAFTTAAPTVTIGSLYTPGSIPGVSWVPIDKACAIFVVYYRTPGGVVPAFDMNGDGTLETNGITGIGGGGAFYSTQNRFQQIADAYFDEKGTSQGIPPAGAFKAGAYISSDHGINGSKLFTATWYVPEKIPHYARADTLTDALGTARGPSTYYVGGKADTLTDAKAFAISSEGVIIPRGISSTIDWAYTTNRANSVGRDLIKEINDGLGIKDAFVFKNLDTSVINVLPLAIMMLPDEIPLGFKSRIFVEAIDNVLRSFEFDPPGPSLAAYLIDFETGARTIEVDQTIMTALGSVYYYDFTPQQIGVYQIIAGGNISGSLRIVARPVTVRHRFDPDAQDMYGQLFNRF